LEDDLTASKVPPLKKTKKSPGARAAAGGGSSVVDMPSPGTQPAFNIPAAAVIQAAAAAAPGTNMPKIEKRKANKGRNGKIVGCTDMTKEERKKTKNSPDLNFGARAAAGGESSVVASSVVDKLCRGQAATLGKIRKKAKKGKIAGSKGMTKEEMKMIEVEVLKPLTEELSVLMRLPPEAQVEAAVDACDKCLNSVAIRGR
jgi:hypothetical protein